MLLEQIQTLRLFLKSYMYYGLKCFEKFNGMWSIIIYDDLKKETIISRDRFGIKPLFYIHQKNKILFSSEIKPLLSFLKNKNINA